MNILLIEDEALAAAIQKYKNVTHHVFSPDYNPWMEDFKNLPAFGIRIDFLPK